MTGTLAEVGVGRWTKADVEAALAAKELTLLDADVSRISLQDYSLPLYDADLDQVTVKPLNEALSGTPAALLAGNHAIEKYFSLRNAGTAGGLEWLEAIPRSKDTTFERIRMGFRGNTLAQMELIDQLGQRTMLTFTNFSRNPAIPASRFRFSPPKGTDVIGG